MKNFYAILVLSILCLPITRAAINEENAPTGEITGQVIDMESSEPVAFASVAIISVADSTIVTGVITNDEGKFAIGNLPLGIYKVEVSFLGYAKEVIEKVDISRKNRSYHLGQLAISPATENLEEVTFATERLKGEEKIDRTVFTINDDIRKASTSGIDLLKHIPSVSVDFMENITVEGQSDFQFYVDGVLRNQDFVAQLNPQDIDKVELITNPGVKYDADISAIINIVLRKNKKSGVAGSVLIPLTNPNKAMMNPRANLEYGNEHFRVYAGDRMHYERFRGREELYTRLDESNPNPYEYSKLGEGYNSWRNNYLNYGIDWFVSERTSINFLGEWERSRGISDDYLSTHRLWTSDGLQEFYETEQNSRNTNDNYFFSTYVKQLLPGEGHEITAELRYYTTSSRSQNEYLDRYYDPEDTDNLIEEVYRGDLTDNLRNTIEGKLDYTFQIKQTKHEAGLRLSELWMNNEFSNNVGPGGEENLVDEFNYLESRRAGYYNITGTLKSINWQAGLRGEYSNVELSDTLSVPYFELLPQISLSRGFDKGQTVKFSFRRKLNRPYIRDLNPFVTWTDSLHVRVGNPELRPALENRFELSYGKNFGNNYVSPKLYFRYTKDGIQDLSEITDDGVTVISRANIGQEMEYGLGLNAALQVFKIWRINAYGSVFNRIVESDHALSLDEGNQKVSWSAGGSSIVQLPKDFSVFVWTFYNSPNINYQREFYRDWLYIFGVEKQFSENAKLSVMYNPFIKEFTYTRVITQAPGYYEEWAGSVDALHLFSIEFTYNFNYGGKVNKINRSVEYEKSSGGGTF